MRIINCLLFIGLMVVLTGCPYESEVSIGNATAVESALLNNRYTVKTSDGVQTEVFFAKKSGNEYTMSVLRYEKDGEKDYVYDVINTKLGNNTLFELKKDNKYYVVKYILAGWTLHVWYMNERYVNSKNNGKKFASGDEFRKFISDNISNDSLFIEQTSFVLFSPEADMAKQYYNYIKNEENKIVQSVNLVYSATKGTQMKQNLYIMTEQITASKKTISLLQRFDGNAELRQASLKLFDVYQSIADNELTNLVNIMKKGVGTDDVAKEKEGIEKNISDKRTAGKDEFNKVGTAFATKYGFTLD